MFHDKTRLAANRSSCADPKGERYLRFMLVLGAHAVLKRARLQPEKYPLAHTASRDNRSRFWRSLLPTRRRGSSGPCWRRAVPTELRSRRRKLARGREVVEGVGAVGRRVWRKGRRDRTRKPVCDAVPRARGSDLDLVRELPYGPAADHRPHQRPDRWQHPT